MAIKSKRRKQAEEPAERTNGNGNGNGHQDFESPLELFGEAKKAIEGVFERLDKSLDRIGVFYSELEAQVDKEADTKRAQQLQQSIRTIQGVLARNQMKVAFFGRTSNGKSTVINAILHDRVLPMGYGHTTGCFLQIQGSQPGSEPYLEVQRKGQPKEQQVRQPIQSVSSIANALNTTEALECSTLVKIHWPISKCSLLKYDVVLVDSPGVDVEEDLDQWIDEHCHDADVFVLVSNAESTLNIAEKNFFHKVSQKLSKPNIFILNNRWDSIADDPDSMDQVRRQHTERSISFLCDELKITTLDDARQRTFFVSARETLQVRTSQADTCAPTAANQLKQGYQERAREFESFERRFEESLSKSAVKTKFKKHTDRGVDTIQELEKLLKSTQARVVDMCETRRLELEQNQARADRIGVSVEKNLYNMEERIQKAKTGIEIAFDKEFDTEVRRLARIVDDYEEEFSTQPDKLELYKRGLYAHLQKSLGSTFNTKVNSLVAKVVGEFNKEMCWIGQLLSEERQRRIEAFTKEAREHLLTDDMIDLDHYKQFYTQFQEDLEFRFSLGLVSIIRRFQSKFSHSSSVAHQQLSQTGVGGVGGDSYLEQSTTATTTMPVMPNTDMLSILERLLMNPPQSPTTVGTLAVGGILVRTVGWKVIVITSLVYGTLYAYEYFTWTSSAKEASFRSQYVRYARKGLRTCVPILSQQISRSIERELLTTYTKVRREVEEESGEIGQTMGSLRSSLEKLMQSRHFSSALLKANELLLDELVNFSRAYL